MQVTLRVWRQRSPDSAGESRTYQATDVSPDMSFLELLDEVNEELIRKARSRSPSITTAAKGSVACARR